MRILLLISFQLYFICNAFSQDSLKLIRLSDTVGDTIDASENAKIKLFPFFSSKDFKYAQFFITSDSAIYLKANLNDSVQFRKISVKEFDWMKARVEKNLDFYYTKYSSKIYTDSLDQTRKRETRWGLYCGSSINLPFSNPPKSSNIFGIEVQWKYHLFGFRIGDPHNRYPSSGIHYTIKDWSFLYGIATQEQRLSISVAAGPAITSIIQSEVISPVGAYSYTIARPSHTVPGLAYQSRIMFIPFKFLSFGVYFMGNVCEHSFFRSGFVIQIGKHKLK